MAAAVTSKLVTAFPCEIAYTDQTIDQGYRAVNEVLALEGPTAARA